MFSFVSFFLFLALASRVMSFKIAVNNMNLTTAQILSIPSNIVTTTCATNCTTATAMMQSCGDDPRCLCRADTVAALLNCEQCMFTKVVELNKKMDFRLGSQAVLAGYSASCKDANITLAANQTSLKLPPSWDGPYVAVLPVGTAVVYVIFAGIFGFSAILLLSNM